MPNYRQISRNAQKTSDWVNGLTRSVRGRLLTLKRSISLRQLLHIYSIDRNSCRGLLFKVIQQVDGHPIWSVRRCWMFFLSDQQLFLQMYWPGFHFEFSSVNSKIESHPRLGRIFTPGCCHFVINLDTRDRDEFLDEF